MISDERLTKAAFEYDAALVASLPDPSECTHVFSASFENKIKKLIRKANHIIFYKCVRRIACAIAALFIAGSIFVAFNPTARAVVVEWFKERIGDVYHYFFVGEDTQNKETAPLAFCPTWVPEGYVLHDSFNSPSLNAVVFLNKTGEVLQFSYIRIQDGNAAALGRGEYKHKVISVNGFTAEVYLALDADTSNVIVWIDEKHDLMFTVFGLISEENLVKMAMNVEEK